ncbi:hypothetical protein H3143_01945 [Mycoplasma tullyi]|uniref:Haemagglutinin Mycoplasma domain-containing protein n=1 Tax=Mycoplasma tullyi TaxID=1612150 RepID=A0A7D7U2V9_9MOLU|nr:hypothetical protein [Mycoplasma tullyi]QMT98250.1 hypothetical protein H3143_01945 [Mycoplasma tullyi]
MKRKNILKFVSLLGIGSFVMLAAASCSRAINANQNPNSKSTPATPTTPTPAPLTPAQELAAAKTALMSLVDSETQNTGLYADYAKIQDNLKNAFLAAKTVLSNSSSTTQNLNEARTKLQSAIANADMAKKDFDTKNSALVTAYNSLKESLKVEETILDSVKEPNYSAIKNNLVELYGKAKPIVMATLDPLTGSIPEASAVMGISEPLANAVMRNDAWKRNADNLVNSFVKQVLVKNDLTPGKDKTYQDQPGIYSFVGYSVDLNTTQANTTNNANQGNNQDSNNTNQGNNQDSNNTNQGNNQDSNNTSQNKFPNWNFAQRVVWTAPNSGPNITAIPNNAKNSKPLSDVSWIYSLAGEGAKYTLKFRNFGVSEKAFLYFPYKLVNSMDSGKVALQYKVNEGEVKNVDFKTTTTVATATSQPEALQSSSTVRLVEDEEKKEEDSSSTGESAETKETPTKTTMNEAPTLNDIKVAKVELTGLKFGLNTVEFSLPTSSDQMDKVAPMIGNMYITTSDQETNKEKIYADIFGNTINKENEQTSVTVDLLKGYSLAASYDTYIRQYTNLNTDKTPVYLVGLIGGAQSRNETMEVGVNNGGNSARNNTTITPNAVRQNRTLIIYVNAPQDGNYYISGSYANANQSRSLYFTTENDVSDSSKSVTINVTGTGFFNSLLNFNTKEETTMVGTMSTTGGHNTMNMNKTLHLKKGINKIVLGRPSGFTPFIGNLTFTLMNSTDSVSKVEADKAN